MIEKTIVDVLSIEEKGQEKIILISNERPFNFYEYYTIEDEFNKNPICRVCKCHAIRRLADIDNNSILKAASTLSYDKEKVFYWAEVQIEKELNTALNPLATASITEEKEMISHLYENDDDELIFGQIRGTESTYKNLKNKKLKNILCMSKDYKLAEQDCLPLLFDYKNMQQNPGIGIFGNSGSGKTFTLKSIIEEFIKHEVPLIVLDPHNEFDFSKNINGLPKDLEYDYNSRVDTFIAGDDFGIRFTDLSNEEFKYFIENVTTLTDAQNLAIDETRTVQSESFETYRLKIDNVATAMMKNYEGKDELTEEEKMLLAKYTRRITSPTTLVSLSSKLASFSRKKFFSSNYDNIVTSLKNKKTVIIRGEYNMVAPMMGHILSSLWRKRKDYKDHVSTEEYPPLIMILDESHLYAPRDSKDIKAPMKQPLRDISREGRKYGMFLICATQRVSELDNTVISQMSTKIILKTSQESDRQIIKKECGLSEFENSRLHLLDSGCGYIVSPVLKSKTALAFKARSNYTAPKSTINVFDELKSMKASDSKDIFKEYLLTQMPIKKAMLPKISSAYSAYSGVNKDLKQIAEELDLMVKNNEISVRGVGYMAEYFIEGEEIPEI